MNITLVEIAPRSLDDFLEAFDDYRRELEPYADEPDTLPLEAYGNAFRTDPGGQELLWIIAEDVRVGFLLLRAFDDWPDTTKTVLDIAECYVEPQCRRHGVGRAAIEALLERERERGTALVEASVLTRNAAALAFWQSLGFAARSTRTAREP